MPINAPRRAIGRRQVAWFESTPPADGQKAFEDRGFLVTSCTDADMADPGYLAGLSAVVFTQSAGKPRQIDQNLRKYAQRLLNYACLVILRPGSVELSEAPSIITRVLVDLHLWALWLPPAAATKLTWQRPMDGEPPPPCVLFCGYAVPWLHIANYVADNPPDAAPNPALKISLDRGVDALHEDSELLLRRAFWDCSDIHLVALDEGRSGVRVYHAYAELAEGLLGRWPLPYFVKIGERNKVVAEYQNYEASVRPYVPFHLGPHLDRERCCLGAREGIIVGDYVEESESLRDCAIKGRAASAIACLFDRTLLGWHRGARKESIPLAVGLLGRFPRKISSQRLARAKALGATRNLTQLRSLFERCTSQPVLVGRIHGDLHADNVRVRATDAIVIDFYAHCDNFPLMYDAACLEASLLVEGFTDDDRDIQEWLDSVAPLYRVSLFDTTSSHQNPKDRSYWFHSCVRQIRRYARQWECGEGQYAATLAIALLTKAVKDKNALEPEASRRAAAYVLAASVLQEAFAEPTPGVLDV